MENGTDIIFNNSLFQHPKDSEKENKLFDRNVIIHSANETSEETIHRLKAGINNKTLSYNDGINGIFNMVKFCASFF